LLKTKIKEEEVKLMTTEIKEEKREKRPQVFLKEAIGHIFYPTASYFLVILWCLGILFVLTGGGFPLAEVIKGPFFGAGVVAIMACIPLLYEPESETVAFTEQAKRLALKLALIPLICGLINRLGFWRQKP